MEATHYQTTRRGDQSDQQRGRDVPDRADRGRVRDLVIEDNLGLLVGALGPRQPLEGSQRAILRRLFGEQDRLGTLPRLEAWAGIEMLEIPEGTQDRPVELLGIALVSRRVVRDREQFLVETRKSPARLQRLR